MPQESIRPREVWQEMRDRHRLRLAPVLEEHQARRARQEAHPVIDFLFTYYRFRPARLLAWSPGVGVTLEGGDELLADARYRRVEGGVSLAPDSFRRDRIPGTEWILSLLKSVRSRGAFTGCYGLHEWAMVYRAGERRHGTTPLRLPPREIDAVVDQGALSCTHYDAFRFYTPDARPLNRNQMSPGEMVKFEQPGCLHTNMDLYRWGFKRYPWISSDLIADAFLLALEIREVDMRASPYDLAGLGLEAIPIETAEGRAVYRAYQTSFAERAAPLRDRLIAGYEQLLAAVTSAQEG